MDMVVLKTPEDIEVMRGAGRVVAEAHRKVREMIAPGMTTREIDREVEAHIRAQGAIPAFLGYPGPPGVCDFPASICASINDEVVHGLPDDRPLKEGDVVSVDIGAELDGFFGDSAWTYPVGTVGRRASRLLRDTEASLFKGIAAIKSGNRIRDISHAIQSFAEGLGYGVVRKYVGHGIGREMHEAPQVPNYVSGEYGDGGPTLKPGFVLAVEPMLNLGRADVKTLDNGWTVVTKDRSLSAHFEHTIALTESGTVLTTEL